MVTMPFLELRNIALVAEIIINSALAAAVGQVSMKGKIGLRANGNF